MESNHHHVGDERRHRFSQSIPESVAGSEVGEQKEAENVIRGEKIKVDMRRLRHTTKRAALSDMDPRQPLQDIPSPGKGA